MSQDKQPTWYHSWLFYWTDPPEWPRKLLCENRYIASYCTRQFYIVAGTILLTYFLIMDLILFSHFRSADLARVTSIQPGEIYSPFTHLTAKSLLNDHLSQFVIAPSTEYFDMITHFSSIFSFISPNMISIFHMFCGFISGRFIASSVLLDRQLGVWLYLFRTWLDAFDGTVFRAQHQLRLKYNSDHTTWGYLIDSACDTLGGIFLTLGIFFYLLKRFNVSPPGLPLVVMDSTSQAPRSYKPVIANGGEEVTYSFKYILWKAITLGAWLGITGKCWDKVVDDFMLHFQKAHSRDVISLVQFDLCHSYTNTALFYLWRLFGGQSTLLYVLLAVHADKIWEVLKGLQWVLIGICLVLYTITAIHINCVAETIAGYES